MALSLGVNKGDRFYIDDEVVEVIAFMNYTRAVLQYRGKQFKVNDKEATKVAPEVYVSCGKPLSVKAEKFGAIPRLLIDAPRRIVILREELYARKHGAVPDRGVAAA